MNFIPHNQEPIWNKLDILIRIVLPIGILILLYYSFDINHEIQCLYHTNATGVGVCN